MKKLLFAIFLFASVGAFAQQQNASVVSVTGKGTINIVPDKVVIRARVEHTGKSASEVKQQNDKVVNEVIKYLKSQDIDPKNIQTEYINLNKEFNYNTKETLFSANQALSIQLQDISKYEKIMGGLLESGLNRIDGIEFQTSKKEELESQARQFAVLNAREKAKEYAEALGQGIGKAQRIEELESGNFPPMYRVREMSADTSEKQTLAPGELEITVKVNVAFELL